MCCVFVKCENSRPSNHTEAFIESFTDEENDCHVAAVPLSQQTELQVSFSLTSASLVFALCQYRLQCGFSVDLLHDNPPHSQLR